MKMNTRWKTVRSDNDYGRPAGVRHRDVDWAPYEHDAEVAGARLHYLDYGERGTGGDVFVLAHGLGGRWQHWRENIAALAEHGRVIAVDLPGFGRSQPLPGGYSLDGFADAIAALVQRLEVPKVVFLGHSLGGPLSVRFANRHPELVRAIVLVAGTVQTFADALSPSRFGRGLRRRAGTVVATYFEVLTAALPAPGFLRRQVITQPTLRRPFLWPYLYRPAALPADGVALLVDGAGAPGAVPTARAVGRLQPGHWLTDVKCPVMAIGADHDPISPLSDLAAYADAVPAAHTVVIEGTGHMLMLERPDAFNAEIVKFVHRIPYPAATPS
jgi:cis-3-alkyl-4-acyloxetan-2-one decarboxylase